MNSVTYLAQGKVAMLSRSGAMVTANTYLPEHDLGAAAAGAKPSVVSFESYGKTGLDQVAPWGKNNLKPNYLLQLLNNSNINPGLIWTKVSFALGRVYLFKWETDENGVLVRKPFKNDDLTRKMNSRKVQKILRSRATDFFIHGNVWNKFRLNKGVSEIAEVQHVDAFRCRLELEKKGMVRGHYLCPDWKKPSWKADKKNESATDANVIRIPAFNEDDPLRYRISAHHSKFYWSGQTYYGIQPWHSAHNWINYANQMPVWMSANINRAFNIKYHIKYPESYFDYLEEQYETKDERQAERNRVFDQIDTVLAGAENAQTTLFTSFSIDEMTGRSMAGWEITAVKNDLKDDAFVKAYETSNSAMTSAQNVDPSLANVQEGGLMKASGSEKRISYQLHEVLKTDEVRQIMFEPWEIMRDVNGWDPDIQFGIHVRNIVTLAEDKSGTTTDQSTADNGSTNNI